MRPRTSSMSKNPGACRAALGRRAMEVDPVRAEVLAVDVGADPDLGVAKRGVLGPGIEAARDPVGREEVKRAAVEEERALGQQRDLAPEKLRIAAAEAAIGPEDGL